MRFPVAPLVPVLALLAGCRIIRQSDFERIGETEARIEVGGARRLVVRNTVGDVIVRTDAEATVTAKAVVYHRSDGTIRTAGPEDLRVEVEGEAVIVENAHRDDPDRDDWKMSIVVSAPPGLDLEFRLGVGDGTFSGAFGEISAEVGVGELEVRAESLRGGRAKTGVGELTVEVGAEGPAGALECETGVGEITLAVPAAFDGELSLRTGVGEIDVRNASDVHVDRTGASASCGGRLGGGPGRITAKTGVGEISFARR
ncbi:MAG: hypothetical protein L0323_05900 [Planctomycetes bacterium]|nr:hypothetical protein [Planctomycetota bacterium]